MDVSVIPDYVWQNVLREKMKVELESLSLKILLSNLRMKLRANPHNEALYISEIRKHLEVQVNFPTIQRDIEKIKTQGGIQ